MDILDVIFSFLGNYGWCIILITTMLIFIPGILVGTIATLFLLYCANSGDK